MNIEWEPIWLNIFGTTTFLGLNIGFWVTMAIVAIIVIIQNIVFWKGFKRFGEWKPKHKD
ncbi:MAG: hypothetical protein LUB61_03850 [Eggerthellaceae bacterium]|nr:hypothetical protein [Eggerthellaceae bacterium]